VQRILIPDACWTTEMALLPGGRSAVDAWLREKAAFLEQWVQEKHEIGTRGWHVNTQHPWYYWG
jgi:hypothetical protein